MNPKSNTSNPASLARTAERRSGIYAIIAAVYARPADEKFIELLRHWVISKESLSQEAMPASLVSGLGGLDAWFQTRTNQTSAELCTALSPEFTRLFRGVKRTNSPLPPYESVYLDGGRLFGESTVKVTESMQKHDLKPAENEPPDHISLEFDFMRILSQEEYGAWRAGTEGRDLLSEEATFLDEHILRWVPEFCDQVRKFDTTGFYKALADITEGWIGYDRTVVKGLIETSR